MRLSILIAAAAMLVAAGCSEAPAGTSSSEVTLENELKQNTSWPYQVVGVLDIVDAGFDPDTGRVSWAAGAIVTENDPDGVLIMIEEGAVRDGIDIDSGKKVRAWLGEPNHEYGAPTYTVSRVESL